MTDKENERMTEWIKNTLPGWIYGDDTYDLVLSDDIDSLASCALLKQIKGWNIRYFYNFEEFHASKELKNGINEKCWVDVAVAKGKGFDNHVSMLTMWDNWNRELVNINRNLAISRENYHEKYAGSTLLQIYSLYDIPLPKTEEGKMILLSIDSAFKGFFYGSYHGMQRFHLEGILGLTELYECVQRHTEKEFNEIGAEYGIKEKIEIKDGKLQTNMDLKKISKELEVNIEVPKEDFIKFKELKNSMVVCYNYNGFENTTDLSPNFATFAFTGKNKCKFSKIIKKNGEKK